MSYNSIPVWKEAPFIRLIIPLMTGILLEWNLGISPAIYHAVLGICFLLVTLFSLLKSFSRYKHYWLSGLFINIALICIGGSITFDQDIRHSKDSITNSTNDDVTFIVTLKEPLAEKASSFKAVATVNGTLRGGTLAMIKGNIIIYFQKDNSLQRLAYGSRLSFHRKLQAIKNSGNPGAFDYQRYCAFQQVFYQVYLRPEDFVMLPNTDGHSFNGELFRIRKSIVTILQAFIAGEKEAGLAEALLIGYKDDLDKNLVQLYSNTGVVHIIAISGLHLGLIYWLLSLILKPLKAKGKARWVKAILIISALWLFSLLTGGSASVCRSALMFSFIVTGENLGRKTNIYNSLAASAFLLLCYNPYWLWDAGFQLSYIAVLSIVIFMKPVYNWFYIKNKLLDHTWKMAAISIAAQILTTPVSIFHFQQFPNYFLITNVVAVPLSSLIVLAEIALCAVSFFPFVASGIGIATFEMIRLMNGFIAYINKMPGTTTSNLNLSPAMLIITYLVIIFFATWLLARNRTALIFAIAGILCFASMKSYLVINAAFQQRLIVYNVPHRKAIDLIKAKHSLFICDSMAYNNTSLQKFFLTPSRNFYRVDEVKQALSSHGSIEEISGWHVIIITGNYDAEFLREKHPANIVILSGNPRLPVEQLAEITECRQIIFDGTNSNKNISMWKDACKKINMPCYSVSENGAFIFNLN